MKRIVCIALAAVMLTGCGGQEMNLESAKADLSKFEHQKSDDSMILKSYDGKSKVLYIQPEYEVNDKNYTTDLSEFVLDTNKVKFLILGDGIKTINNAVFNFSDVESVYFPESMEVVYDATLNYLHPDEGEKIQIYYGGTEEEWNSIFTKYQRQTAKEALDSSDDPYEQGAALGASIADKLNSMMGSYSASDFEYLYSVSESDLEDIIKDY